MRVAILGYGLMGRLCAMALAQQAELHIFTQESPQAQQSTGWKAAAMLAPVAESVHAPDRLIQLGWHAMRLWPSLLARLSMPVYFQQAGTLVVAHRTDLGLLQQFQNLVNPSEKSKIRVVEQQAISDLEPTLGGQFAQGLLLTEEGHVDNQSLYLAIDHWLKNQTAYFHWQSRVMGDPLHHVTSQLKLDVDWVIDCRGHGATLDWPDLRGVRGEVIRVHAPDVTLNRPIRLMHPRYPLYVVPKPNKQFVLGATEIESDEDSPISVRSSLTLLSAAFSLHAGFGEARVLQADVGLRPTLPDHQPQIRVKNQLIAINGLYRHGYLLGPAISQMVAHFIRGTSLGELQKFESLFVHQE